MTSMFFGTSDYEFYQLFYYETNNRCSGIDKLPTPGRVERTYSSLDNRLTITAYWTGNDCRKPIVYRKDNAKFVIRYQIGKIARYMVASKALVNRSISSYTDGIEYSVTFECDESLHQCLGTIIDYVNTYRKWLEYSIKYQERNDDMNSERDTQPRPPHIHYYQPEIVIERSNPMNERGKQLLIQCIYYNEPNTVVKWSDGSQTVVGCSNKDSFDKEIGLAVAIAEKYFETLGLPYPRAALKSLAKSGKDQTEKTKARKAFKAAKKKLKEEKSTDE